MTGEGGLRWKIDISIIGERGHCLHDCGSWVYVSLCRTDRGGTSVILDDVIDSVRRFYFESADFNGYPRYQLMTEHEVPDSVIRELVRNLLVSGEVDCVFASASPNPHIRAFSDVPIHRQLELLDDQGSSCDFCLYPSRKALSACSEATAFESVPYKHEIAVGGGQLDFRVFDLSILEYYRNDPRYHYAADDISGRISVRDEFYESDSMPERNRVALETFGFAYDNDFNRAIAVFLRYLSKLTPDHQSIWAAHAIGGGYSLHPDYYQNAILGEWGTRISIFEAFVEELSLVNEMTALMGRGHLFKNSFARSRPGNFAFLLRPTQKAFDEFVMVLDKMISDNIDREFFSEDLSLETDTERADGKVVVVAKGTISLLKEWVNRYWRPAEPEPVESMFQAFRTVRKLRQKPAHAVVEDAFDQEIFKQQRRLIIDAYAGLRTLRLLLANHPEVRKNPPEIDESLHKGEIWDI